MLARRVASSLGFRHRRAVACRQHGCGPAIRIDRQRVAAMATRRCRPSSRDERAQGRKARVDRVMTLAKETRAHMCEPVVQAREFRPCLAPSPSLTGVRRGPDRRWRGEMVASTRCRRSFAPTWAAGAWAGHPTREKPAGLRFLAVDGDHEGLTPEPAKHDGSALHPYVHTHGTGNLNVGNCMAYRLAKIASATLLFEGNDFSRSDSKPALKA